MDWVKYEKADRVGIIKLVREDKLNVFNLDSGRELLEAIHEASEDREVRCVVLTGSGKAFCAGGDISVMKRFLQGERKLLKDLTACLHLVVAEMVRMEKPVITAINGVAAGAGIGLALAGDLAYASPSATFVFAYPSVGLSPDGGASLLAREIGYRRAMELMLTGRKLPAEEAFSLGLINGVFEQDCFYDSVLKVAGSVASGPAKAYAAGKVLFRQAFFHNMETHLEAERQALVRQSQTPEFREGVASFLAKKPPRFEDCN
jgi:2-(1,2-epoxy-1,2-dihydrophenyl)acetyl-CoA isomerase